MRPRQEMNRRTLIARMAPIIAAIDDWGEDTIGAVFAFVTRTRMAPRWYGAIVRDLREALS